MGDGPKRVLRGLKWGVRGPERLGRKPDNRYNGKRGLKKQIPASKTSMQGFFVAEAGLEPTTFGL